MEKYVRDAFFAESRHAYTKTLRFPKGTTLTDIIGQTQRSVSKTTLVFEMTISSQLHLDADKKIDNNEALVVTVPFVSEYDEELYTHVWNESWGARTLRDWGEFLAAGASRDPVSWWAEFKPFDDSPQEQIPFRNWIEQMQGVVTKRKEEPEISGESLHPLLSAYGLDPKPTRRECFEALDALLRDKRLRLAKLNYSLAGMAESKESWKGEVKETVSVKWTIDAAEPEFWADAKGYYNTCVGEVEDWAAFSVRPPSASPPLTSLDAAVKHLRNIVLFSAQKQKEDVFCKPFATEGEYFDAIEKADRRIRYVTDILRYAEPLVEVANKGNDSVEDKIRSIERAMQSAQTEISRSTEEVDKLKNRIDAEREWADTETRERRAQEDRIAAENVVKRARGDTSLELNWPLHLHDAARRFFRGWIQSGVSGADDLIDSWIRSEIEHEDVANKEGTVIDVDPLGPVVIRRKTIRDLDQDVRILNQQLEAMPITSPYRLDLERNLKLKIEYLKHLLDEYQADLPLAEYTRIQNELAAIPMYATPLDELLNLIGQVDPVLKNELEALPNGIADSTEAQRLAVLRLRHVPGPVQYTKPQAPILSGSVKNIAGAINAGGWKPV